MKAVHWLLTVAVAWWFRQDGAAAMPSDCERRCGDVTIPYPFGLNSTCARSTDFLLNCKNTEGSGFRLMQGNLTIHNISVEESNMAASFPEAYECYDRPGTLPNKGRNATNDLPPSPLYRLSNDRNKLILLGCNTLALLANSSGGVGSGCMTYCFDNFDVTKETGAVCSGQGCCQAYIPKGLKTLDITIHSLDEKVPASQLGHCVRAFVVDKSFNISNFTLPTFEDVGNTPSFVLDWMVTSNMTCQKAKLNQSSYACRNNTKCGDFGLGYRCFCKDGYDGNPYDESQGCTDINECEDPTKNRCRGKCKNTAGSHTCYCPFGMMGGGEAICQISPWVLLVPVL